MTSTRTASQRGAERVRELGPVLGSYHPVIAYNVERLRRDFRTGRSVVPHVRHRGGDAGGTTRALSHAPLASGALLRRLSRLVGRCSAGHRQSAAGTGDLHAGDMSEQHAACAAHAPRHRLRPGQSACRRCIRIGAAPADSSAGGQRKDARISTGRPIPLGCKQLRAVCTEQNIVLIFDEVFVGFRLAPGGASEYFGVRPDLVTYGKTLGGGLPVGVLCGRQAPDEAVSRRPAADICLARGTFNSHPDCDGGDERVPAPLRIRRRSSGFIADLDELWNAGRSG